MTAYGRRWRIIAVLGILAALLSGCGTPDRPAQQSSAPPASAPTAPPRAAPQPVADQLYIRSVAGDSDERLAILDSVSGAREQDLPIGVIASDWSALYTAAERFAAGRHTTEVRAVEPKTGHTLRTTTIDGAYALPQIGEGGAPGGLSPDGRWLVLEAAPAQIAGRWQSNLAVLDTAFARPPRYVKLDTDNTYRFDGIANGGDGLYLIEYLSAGPQPSYQVRYYDVAKGALDPNIVVSKGEEDVMSGARHASVVAPNGVWLYSLYLNDEHGPFIHALDMADRFAVCIDLPLEGKDDEDAQSYWSLTMDAGGKTIYAVNAALNMVAEVSADELHVRRTATIAAPAASTGPLDGLARWLFPTAAAKGEQRAGAVVSPDGKTLFMLGQQGLLALNTADLKLRSRFLADRMLTSVALSPDGARLYVISAPPDDQGPNRIVQLDPASGAIRAEVRSELGLIDLLRVEARR